MHNRLPAFTVRTDALAGDASYTAGMGEREWGFRTRALHAGARPDPTTGARAVPIYQSTSFVFEDTADAADLFALQKYGTIYTRISNPTTAAFEERMASLEGGIGAVATSSGQAAEFLTAAALTASGDNFVTSSSLYGGTHTMFDVTLGRFGIDARFVDGDDPESFAAAIDDRTILLVGSAPGYAHGVVDPIEAIGALGLEHDVPVHVDGCIGAWLLPFLEECGAEVPLFDFRAAGVTSISMDLHKYAFAPKGASVLLMRDAEHRRHQIFACSHWSGYGVVNTTMQSTKSGGPLAGAWAVMRHLGRDGYRALAAKVHAATEVLVKGAAEVEGLRLLGQPVMGLLAIASDGSDAGVDVFELSDALARRGWQALPQLSFGQSPANLHLMIEPGNAPHAEAFLKDLHEAAAEVRANPPAPLPAMLEQAAGMLTPAMVKAKYVELIAMLGGGGDASDDGLPEARAELNRVLDRLAPETREALLVEFMSHFFR